MIPLSYAQARIWFYEQVAGAGSAYNLPYALRLRGDLDTAALRSALVDVLIRHEALRTLYLVAAGEPYQRVVPAAQAQPVWTVAGCTEPGLTEHLADACNLPFDLTTDLPIRPHLVRLGPREHVLLVMHHIATDGWSLGPLARDLAAAYRARSAGTEPAWEPLPVQYTDYTLWQHELLGSVNDPESLLSQQLAHWRTALDGLPEEAGLPLDRPRPATPSHKGTAVALTSSAELHRRLLGFARQHNATLFMVVQAALATLMSRLGAGTDIPLGTATAGRTEDELEELVGFFVNTLVLRTDLSGDPSFGELVDRVRESDLLAFANQDVPFERLVEELNPVRSLARHPLFQIMLLTQRSGNGDGTGDGTGLDFAGLASEPVPVGTDAVKFDLTLAVGEAYRDGGPVGLRLNADFATDVLDPASVRRLLAQLLRLLEAALADPGRPISRLDLLSAEERHTLLVEWNDTAHPLPDHRPVHELIADRARQTPAATAVEHPDGSLDYAGLDTRANRLAHHLISLGAGPGRLVGIFLDRGPDRIVALLAVLKSGAAYVPLDVSYPPERVAFIAEDAGLSLVVTGQQLLERLPQSTAEVVLLDDEALSAHPVTAPEVAVRPRDAAYVIYTSGSTGRPKGVVCEHAALGDLCAWMVRHYGLDRADRASQLVTPGFDSAVVELWPVLAAGGTACLPSPELLDDAEALTTWITTAGITVCFMPTPRLEVALDDLTANPGALRLLYLGGDTLRRWPAPGVPFVLSNQYGPTECTVAATSAELGPEPAPVCCRRSAAPPTTPGCTCWTST
ncbi:AMP-binding protein [Streptacidiphilus sp. 4-A2]|nr:AMP-binding protein [Streptacidiphilus sp. 4-A2]